MTESKKDGRIDTIDDIFYDLRIMGVWYGRQKVGGLLAFTQVFRG